ncbi:hypothetical protein KVR01_001878 [Diaporthe batatas]|uniref:uncharacterized protein n=1 Tax=Diaporthe batatas TaxID=748121 RepID=UPI001D03BA7B|nr:uncharacterized protein KVR01_001878 [Diaporthe batatas]KAG8169129.1 hypothetical protein KVR01_001878 [Diaporthe batatas]
MFTTMGLPPVFPGFASHSPSSLSSPSAHRPAISSPLSSSPIRATTPPPLSARDANARRETQSSPISASWSSSPGTTKPVSRFAARPTRPNPVVSQKREAAQESRRKLFLKNVRQRAEDQRWERRGGEQELLKLEWISLNKDLQQAKNADLDGHVFESDIEEASRLREEEEAAAAASGSSAAAPWGQAGQSNANVDQMMVDTLEREQRAEIEEYEAMVAAMQNGAPDGHQWGEHDERQPPDSPQLSDDDDDYDALFMDYLSQEQQSAAPAPISSGEMDLS